MHRLGGTIVPKRDSTEYQSLTQNEKEILDIIPDKEPKLLSNGLLEVNNDGIDGKTFDESSKDYKVLNINIFEDEALNKALNQNNKHQKSNGSTEKFRPASINIVSLSPKPSIESLDNRDAIKVSNNNLIQNNDSFAVLDVLTKKQQIISHPMKMNENSRSNLGNTENSPRKKVQIKVSTLSINIKTPVKKFHKKKKYILKNDPSKSPPRRNWNVSN